MLDVLAHPAHTLFKGEPNPGAPTPLPLAEHFLLPTPASSVASGPTLQAEHPFASVSPFPGLCPGPGSALATSCLFFPSAWLCPGPGSALTTPCFFLPPPPLRLCPAPRSALTSPRRCRSCCVAAGARTRSSGQACTTLLRRSGRCCGRQHCSRHWTRTRTRVRAA
eukprot:191296-Chlamydomonas_euryale.AAC.1